MIGHGCILVETADARILMDPWIFGPANFRSWWHIPEVDVKPESLGKLDYIFISHLHADHFHVPTLQRLDREATALIPRHYHNRMARRLTALEHLRILEMPHDRQTRLRGSTRVHSLHVGNDSALVVQDSSGAILNANDALQGNDPGITLPMLKALGDRYRFDVCFLAFGTAGPFPKCYTFEEKTESVSPEAKERAMLRQFVQGARTVGTKLIVPCAGGFALLHRRLLWMNEVKATPADALEMLKTTAPALNGAEMNYGDVWATGSGIQRNHPTIDWSRRLAMIQTMHERRAQELATIEAEERQGPCDLPALFERRLQQNMRSFPLLRRRLNCVLLFDVEGEPGGQWEVDLRRTSGWFRHGDSGDWMLRLRIPSALLAETLTD